MLSGASGNDLQSLQAHCKAPGGPVSIWQHLEALIRATEVSGRLACGFQTNLQFADARSQEIGLLAHMISFFRCTSNYTQQLPAGSPDTPFVNG
jgi:hypothetical protein